jgi:hypothetical protein
LALDVNGDSRNRRIVETNRRQRRMEASSEGGQGPEGALVPYMEGWMDVNGS